ncbi:hypothetical protein [Rhodococcus sp. 06-235-1A]|uniref:hypothetical protein n=1 Tax=Rhodococcus sp. 06-235-1A TaxID=2022508 RepID=UPI00117B0148|nr:hypothetical protein [Rhodococcus sp. 06-235-1A]
MKMGRTSLRAVAISILAVVSLVLPGLNSVANAGPNDTWIYLVVNNSACGTATPRGILGNVQPTGWTTNSWDNGDSVIYPLVRKNVRNNVSLQVRCEIKRGLVWVPAGYRTISQSIYPTTFQQTIRVG